MPSAAMLDNRLKRPTEDDLQDYTPPQTPAKRSRRSSYANPQSVSTIASDDSFTTKVKQTRRGRPCVLDTGMEDKSNCTAREKNNLASRRSRRNKTDKEHALFREAAELESRYQQLQVEEAKLEKEAAKWKRAVLRLALLQWPPFHTNTWLFSNKHSKQITFKQYSVIFLEK